MKTIISYEGKTFEEKDNSNVEMISTNCACGNELYVPLATIVLGLVSDCAHCGKNYPQENHCEAITESYKGLIEGESIVEL